MQHPESPVRIDINRNTLSVAELGEFEFPLDPFSAYCITRGIDQLDFILQNEARIRDYEQRRG